MLKNDFQNQKHRNGVLQEPQQKEIPRQTCGLEREKLQFSSRGPGRALHPPSVNCPRDAQRELPSLLCGGTHSPLLSFTELRHVTCFWCVDTGSVGNSLSTPYQGLCYACWIFGTSGSLEGQMSQETGKLVSLSERSLVDCSLPQHNQGCKAGLRHRAFQGELGARTQRAPTHSKSG